MRYPTKLEIKAELARRFFWEFCEILAPDFYKEDRHHLKTLCNKLQEIYQEKKNLLIQMPPRHGKSRTLVLFTSWILGKDNKNKIITASYNDDLAQDFSRYTRDIIQEEKNLQEQIVYSDIFDAKIKHGDASYKKWALEGQFFNYKGTGIGGSITGRGGGVIIIDDPIKDAEIAYNEIALEKIWRWYTGTLLSRKEEGAIEILCMTPWAKGDLASKILEIEPDKWEVITMPVISDDKMLCDELLSHESYIDLKNKADELIFSANYLMERMDIKGRLYSGFNTYTELPMDDKGRISIDRISNYTDTADEGTDNLCSVVYAEKDLYNYVLDILYTKEAQEITEPQTRDLLLSNNCSYAIIESNNGGRAFARNVERLIHDKNGRCNITWFHQSKNKKSRIMTNSANVQKYILFPEGWNKRWPLFYKDVMTYQKEGKNKHDDAPDTLTGIIEKSKKPIKVVRW